MSQKQRERERDAPTHRVGWVLGCTVSGSENRRNRMWKPHFASRAFHNPTHPAHLVLEHPRNAALEDVVRDLRVHRREAVIEEVEVGVRVDGARDGHALFLSPAQVDT